MFLLQKSCCSRASACAAAFLNFRPPHLPMSPPIFILYVKLPAFFTVPTPIGNYNPDWALVKEDIDAHGEPTGKENLYLLRETKSTTDSGELRLREEWKISCSMRHFRDALGVDYEVLTSVDEIK